MACEDDDRLATELALLESMYPDQVAYSQKGKELSYTTQSSATLKLRIPDGYLNDTLPEVLSASIGKKDARNQVKALILGLEVGEEVLDSIIAAFDELAVVSETETTNIETEDEVPAQKAPDSPCTIIIWLHHLLNTNKRKQALSPSSPEVSGITKPGYPGVLVYSGPEGPVREHVEGLRRLNWQAFQVRMEREEVWGFRHGRGVVEVEGMRDVVVEVDVEVGRKEVFLEAMRMK